MIKTIINTFKVIAAILFILYLLISHYLKENLWPKKRVKPDPNERSIEEIIGGRPYFEVYDELDAREYEDLTENEIDVLLGITLWGEHNSSLHNDNPAEDL